MNPCRAAARPDRAGFTMVEMAISLAIVGIALVAIVGVLPIGMNVQKDNRETTIINQDASVFLDAIRSGARGLDDLTNYVYAVTNYAGLYKVNGVLSKPLVYGFTNAPSALNSGTNIIGLLSAPEFTDLYGNPTNNLLSGGYSNHIVASVRSISGPAVEKPPQDNDIVRGDSFSYRLYCVNAAVPVDTNVFNTAVYPNGPPAYIQLLNANLHELRLTFLWPLQPSGSLGPGRQTFRALVGGQLLLQTNYYNGNPLKVYFYQPQSFATTP